MPAFLRQWTWNRLPLTFVSACGLLFSCGSQVPDGPTLSASTPTPADSLVMPQQQLPLPVASPYQRAADSIYARLTPEQRAAQLIMVASSTYEKMGAPYSGVRQLVGSGKVANVLFLKGPSKTFQKQSAELRQLLSPTGLQPLLACDCEPSLFKMKWIDVDTVAMTSALNTQEKVVWTADKIAGIMRKTGVNLNFAPVADVGANKATINNRAFGNQADTIVRRANAFITATQQKQVGATVKHFPGHGRVIGDSHKQSVYISGELTELETFRKILAQSQPAAVLMGHIVVRNNAKYQTNGVPSSLSPVIMQNLLRKELGYEGLIITDALNMEAAKRVPDADFKCLQSGADIALMPVNPAALHSRIVSALQKNDTLSRQLEQSVKRVIRYKLRYPLSS